MNNTIDVTRVLAIDPCSRGVGYAIFEGLKPPLIDLGVAQAARDKNIESLRRIADLIRRYQPDVIALEDYSGDASHRCRRVRDLITRIRRLAARRKIKVRAFSRGRVRQAFAPAHTKHQIAVAIATEFPELLPHLPPIRKCWMSEDYRMSIFDAAAFGITYFVFDKPSVSSAIFRPAVLDAGSQTDVARPRSVAQIVSSRIGRSG